MISTRYRTVMMLLLFGSFLLSVSITSALPDNSPRALDTLSLYNNTSKIISYSHPAVQRQAARFVLELPARLQEISLLMNGAAGSFTVRVWGHEGGSSAPLIETDLVEPIVVYKKSEGRQRITIPLSGKNIYLTNNQFFVVIENLPLGIDLLSDSEEKQPSCISESEKFVWQYLQSTDGRWQYGRFGFAIEAVVAYTNKQGIAFATPKALALNVNSNDTTIHKEKSDNNASIACADINKDGYIDVLANGHLFMNEAGTLVDRTSSKGLASVPIGNCFIDMDNDGDIDILFIGKIGGAEPTSSTLFLNDGGTFRKTPLQIPALENPTSFSMADVNQDGYIDVFIAQSVRDSLDRVKNYLLVNNKNLSFENRTDEFLPPLKEAENSLGKWYNNATSTSMGASFVDINNDNLPDLYVVNYYGKSDDLWIGRRGDTFINNKGLEENLQADVLPPSTKWSPLWYSSGGHWADIDGDGSMDLLTARYVPPVHNTRVNNPVVGAVLYKRSAHHVNAPKVMSPFEYEEKQSSGVWGDINNDGKTDCILFSPCVCRYAELYQQQKETQFTGITAEAGLDGVDAVRDGVWVDINNDGLLDLLCVRADTLLLYVNISENNNNYIHIELESSLLNKQAIGAKVVIYAKDDTLTQQVIAGRGLLMQDPARLHYGLGTNSRVDSAIVTWPSGREEKFIDISPNKLVVFKEGKGSVIERKKDILANVSVRPMPFRDIVELSFSLTHTAYVTVSIFTVEGVIIRKMMNASLQAGEHKIVWDGRNEFGEPVSSGTYLYKCSVDGSEIVGAMIRLD